jgi:hypothetical protein
MTAAADGQESRWQEASSLPPLLNIPAVLEANPRWKGQASDNNFTRGALAPIGRPTARSAADDMASIDVLPNDASPGQTFGRRLVLQVLATEGV